MVKCIADSKKYFRLYQCELQESLKTDELALEIAQKKIDFDPIYQFASAYCADAPSNQLSFIRQIIMILYRVGAVGVKLTPADKLIYSHVDEPLISPSHYGPQLLVASPIGPIGHTSPFIARQTRAYLNFEVKDGAKRRRLRRSTILEFKVQIRFSAAIR